MEVVERRRSSTTVGLRRTKSARSSLRVVGARWRTATANTANNVIPCLPTNEELEEPSTVKFLSATQLPSPPVTPPPQKQKSSKTSWLPSFSYHQNKNSKSTSNTTAGKTKEQNVGAAKSSTKTNWILNLTNYQNKQQKTKPVYIPILEEKQTPARQRWVLGLTEEQMQRTKQTSLLALAEQSAEISVSSPQNYMRQKSNSLSRSFPPAMDIQQQTLPVISSVGTQRRNSMWAVNASKPNKLHEGGMEFLADGITKTTKKKVDKVNKISIHLHALFAAVEHGHVDRARTILESTDVNVNSVNSDGLSPLDVAVLSNNRQLAKMLVTFGAQEGNQFKSPESLGSHLKQLLEEAEQHVKELGGSNGSGLMTLDETSCNNNNNHHLHNNINNRSSTSSSSPFSVIGTAAMTGCSGGGGDTTTDKQLMLWERRVKALKKMLLGFDQARPPDVPFLVAVDVTATNSVTIRFQEPEHQDSAICTKFKVQWSCDEKFSALAGEREILDMKHLECHIGDLNQGSRYYFRVACGNLKGYGNFRLSSPASVIPSSWRDVDNREARFAGRLHLLDDLFCKIRHSRPEYAAEIKATTTSTTQSGETPSVQRRNPRSKKTAIKQLFTVASKFQKNLRRGVFLACLLYHEDKVLVTNEDFLPVIEVDETYPSCIYHDFHWLMKVACTWDDVKSLRQDMERSLSSSAVHFRIKLLQAAAQLQAALCIQDLGQLYHKPIRDSQGTLVISTVNYIRSPKCISVLNARWLPLSKVQKKLATHEEPHVGELVMASIQDQITFHQVSSIRLSRGLYLGYLKMQSSVDLIQVVVPSKAPNVLPHCKIRDNPHVSLEEWEWLKRQSARHKTLGCSSSETLSSTSGDEQTGSEDGQTELSGGGTEQQRVFVELVAATARRLFSYMEVSPQEALTHRLYDAEVVDLSTEVSFLIVVPRVESACAVPGQTESLLQRGDLIALPVQVFEMVHLGTYQRDVISRYSRLSCILELDTVLAHHSHREAFSSSEVAAAKDRLSQLQDFQQQLNSAWKGVRWLMDVLTFARDRGSSAMTPGVAMHNLLSGDQETCVNGSCGGGSLKRSLLQLPPRDPKLVKSSTSRGSWPGPGVSPGSVASLLTAELSKSEQHLSTGRNGNYMSLSSSNTGSNNSFVMSGMTQRFPPSRSEDTLLLAKQPPVIRTHTRSRSSTITGATAGGSISSCTSVSASTSPLLSTRGASGGSVHSLSSSDETSSPASTSTSKLATDKHVDEDIASVSTVVPAPASGIIQVFAAYETGLASGTSLKLHVTPRTTAREVVDLVVKQLNMAVVLKGKDGPRYPSDKLKNFCLVAVIGARERCLRDDFKPLQLQNPWKKGRLYVRQKQDVLAALEQSSRHTAYL